VILVLGGARSGKSHFAETLAEGSGLAPVYIATGQSLDDEMAARIVSHQARRNSRWANVEAPFDLAGAIQQEDGEGRVLLVDCLTLWVSNLMMRDADIEAETARLVAVLLSAKAPVVLVSNEVGLGIVPDNAMARAYRDHAGHLNQAVAAAATTVYFIAAGLPLVLKSGG
jgi:adenosylcobinamide kinase/adenosylcobinamide-phosphate guanylyltransferase